MRKILLLILPLFLFACAKRELDDHQTDMGYDYFPVKVGQYRTYAVDSIVFGQLGADTLSSQIKETIVEELNDGLDKKYRVLREWRKSMDDNWQTNTVWWIVKEENRIIQTEENLKFIKLTFPVKLGTSWDGNSFFDDRTVVKIASENLEFFKEWDYQVTGKGDRILSNESFDNVFVIQEADFETSIELRKSTAIYAKGVGLIERMQQILDTQCITCSNAWSEKAEKGVILTQLLIDHN